MPLSFNAKTVSFFSTVVLGQDEAGSLAGRIAAKFAALQGGYGGVNAGLAGEIRMRYGSW